MNEMNESFFRSALGISIGSMRTFSVIMMIAVGFLYIYRLLTVIHCMRQPVSDFAAPTDRMIWVALAMLVPLGLGAFLYDVVRRDRPFVLRFWIPFGVVAICFLCVAIPIFKHSTKFNLDFLGL